jgi:hypothetical protein
VGGYWSKLQASSLTVTKGFNRMNLERNNMKANTIHRTEERRNRFNGESIMLTKQEASRHDAIFLAEIMATVEDKQLGTGASKHWETMRKHLDWFKQHNAKAYMVLLD